MRNRKEVQNSFRALAGRLGTDTQQQILGSEAVKRYETRLTSAGVGGSDLQSAVSMFAANYEPTYSVPNTAPAVKLTSKAAEIAARAKTLGLDPTPHLEAAAIVAATEGLNKVGFFGSGRHALEPLRAAVETRQCQVYRANNKKYD